MKKFAMFAILAVCAVSFGCAGDDAAAPAAGDTGAATTPEAGADEAPAEEAGE